MLYYIKLLAIEEIIVTTKPKHIFMHESLNLFELAF